MNLTPTWSIASDDDYSQHSFVSDADSEFDLSPATRYPDERRSVSALRKLASNRQEPPVTRSRAKAIGRATLLPRSMSKERRRSNIRQSLDSLTSKAMMLTSSIFVPKRHSSDYPVPQSPTDSVNSLTNRLESWTLDEMNSTGRWSSEKTTSHGIRQMNPFSFTASAASPLFDPPQSRLWLHCPLAAAIPQTDWQPNLFTSPSTSTFPINSNNHITTTSNKPSSRPRPHRAKHTFSKALFTLIIFAIGLVLGYLLTNTIPPDLALHWLLSVWNRCAQLTIAWVPLVHLYLQPVLKNCSSFLLI